MLAEHQQRFARIFSDDLERPGADCAEVLHRGQVVSPEDVDPEAWRAELRAQARADKIRVMTFRDGAGAIAARNRTVSDHKVRAELDRAQILGQLATAAPPRARARRLAAQRPGEHLRLPALRRADLLRTSREPVSDGEAPVGAVPGAVPCAARRMIAEHA